MKVKPEDMLYNIVTKYNITVPDLRKIVHLSNLVEFKRLLEDIANTDDYYLEEYENEADILREIANKGHMDMISEFLLEDIFGWDNILIFLKNNLQYCVAMEEIIEEVEEKLYLRTI